MNSLPKDLEDIILNYINQMKHINNFKKYEDELNDAIWGCGRSSYEYISIQSPDKDEEDTYVVNNGKTDVLFITADTMGVKDYIITSSFNRKLCIHTVECRETMGPTERYGW